MKKFSWNDKSVVEAIVQKTTSVTDFLLYIGLSTAGANYRTAKKWFTHHGIVTHHFEERWSKIRTASISRKRSHEEVFCEGSTVRQSVLRSAVIRDSVLEYRCKCGNAGEWEGQPLVLQLDHINGVSNDNRKENLRWLCPNCHTQTTTFAGRNWATPKPQRIKSKVRLSRRKVARPTKDELEKMLWEQPTTSVAKQFNVSDNAVARWAKEYNIKKPARGYWQKQQANNQQ